MNVGGAVQCRAVGPRRGSAAAWGRQEPAVRHSTEPSDTLRRTPGRPAKHFQMLIMSSNAEQLNVLL